MRKTPVNPLHLERGHTIPHQDFVDIWIEQYVQGDAREGVSILLALNRALTNKLEEVTGKKVHDLFPEH